MDKENSKVFRALMNWICK